MNRYEKIGTHVFVTKLAGFEHSKYIQHNETKKKVNSDDIPLVQGKNIRNGRFVEKYEWYIEKKISDNLERSKLNKRCILIPYVGSNLGEVGIFEHPYDCHMASNIAKVELIDDYYDLDYLKYYFQSDIGQEYLFQLKQGSAQPNITMEAIRNTMVIYRDKNVQKKISAVLKKIDSKIDNNNQINNNLEELMKAIYQRWFMEFEFPGNGGRPYKSSGGKLIYNEELKQKIPESWNVSTIGDLLSELECGDRPVGGSYEEGIPSIGAENIIGIGKYNFKNEKYIPIEYFNSMKSGIIRNWDVLLYKDGAGVGQISMVGDNFPYRDCAINSHVFILRSEDNFYQSYLYLTLCQIHIKKMLIALAMKAAQPGLNQPAVKSIKTIIPPRDVLEKFNKYCNITFHKIFCNANENKELTKLKEYLLPLLMNGQINVDDIEI